MTLSSVGGVITALNTAEPAAKTALSPYIRLHQIDEHIHQACNVYPSMAAGTLVESDAAAWTLGTFVQIVPASTIVSQFDLHFIIVEDITANDVLELVLYQGASDTEIARIRMVQAAAFSGTYSLPIMTPIIPANARIRAKVASGLGGTDCRVSLMYHTY